MGNYFYTKFSEVPGIAEGLIDTLIKIGEIPKMKAPVTIYLIIGIIPLVPVALIYYTVESFLSGNPSDFFVNLVYTIKIGGAIAFGILIVSAMVRLLSELTKKVRQKQRT